MGTSVRSRGVGPGTGGAFTLELLGKGPGEAVDGSHISLSRSMVPIQEDKELILGDTYHEETCR